MRAAWLLTLLTSALPASAEVFSLVPPIDCRLGQDCFIQQYMVHDPSPDVSDFTSNGLSYDTHMGTDFALPSLAAVTAGVAALAAPPRQSRGAAQIERRDCGNGMVIRHAGGWETQYCHLKQGAVAVREGLQVAADIITRDAAALVFWSYAFGGRPDHREVLEKNQAQFFRAAGRTPQSGWPIGIYSGSVTLLRADQPISTRQIDIRVE